MERDFESSVPKIRVGTEMRDALERLADEDNRTISDYIRVVLLKHVAEKMGTKKMKRLALILIILTTTTVVGHADDWDAAEREEQWTFFAEVQAPTRTWKPISQTPELITVVTAEDIEKMNAHTLSDVLMRISGVSVNTNRDAGAASIIHLHGAEARHTKICLNGIPLNYWSSGAAEIHWIAVGSIARIEVVRGPASSAWGSAAGGVINISLKDASGFEEPTAGALKGTLGPSNTYHVSGEAAASRQDFGVYAQVGAMGSDGLVSSRGFERENGFASMTYRLTPRAKIGISLGAANPETDVGDFVTQDISTHAAEKVVWSSAFFDAHFGADWTLHLNAHYLTQRADFDNTTLGINGPGGALWLGTLYDEETIGAGARLVYERGIHLAVAGVEFDRGRLRQRIDAGHIIQGAGAPASITTTSTIDNAGFYLNDTITIGKWAITPGVRCDYDSIGGTFLSPSLGLTYDFGAATGPDHYGRTIFRASVARGFSTPPLSWTAGGALFLDPNPDLDKEEIWSFQAGIESAALKHLRFKLSGFIHEMTGNLEKIPFGGGAPAYNDVFINGGGRVQRKGMEIEIETASFYDISIQAAAALVHRDPTDAYGSKQTFSYHISARYDDRESLYAELYGHYMDWDVDEVWGGSDGIIWDVNIRKMVWSKGDASIDLFITGHNIFDGNQYSTSEYYNPRRWVEFGIVFNY